MFPSRTVDDGPVCADHDPEIWFEPGRRIEAMTLCIPCPLRAECLSEWSKMDYREGSYGTWAGLSTRERVRIKHRYGIVTVAEARTILGQVK